eukprot:COSAG01_NODE_1_length_100484_cov_170.446142_18_plen_241_part_00
MSKKSPKTALITGSALRIGAGITQGLAKAGYNLILHYHRSESAMHALSKTLKQYPITVRTFQADLSHDKLCTDSLKQFDQPIDLLINNASIFPERNFLEETAESYLHNYQINFLSPFFLSQAFIKSQKKGHIINILDSAISSHDTQRCAYLLAKKNLANLSQMLAKDFAPHFRCNGICPGYILDAVGSSLSKFEKEKKLAVIPLKQQGNIQQIIDAVLFLEKATFTTGQLLYIDGGNHIT